MQIRNDLTQISNCLVTIVGGCVCRRIRELEGILERLEDDSKSKVENTSLRLQEKTSEVARYTLENDQLKVDLYPFVLQHVGFSIVVFILSIMA